MAKVSRGHGPDLDLLDSCGGPLHVSALPTLKWHQAELRLRLYITYEKLIEHFVNTYLRADLRQLQLPESQFYCPEKTWRGQKGVFSESRE